MTIIARKGTLNLVKYDNGMYAVERITKGCAFGYKYSFNKFEVIDVWNEMMSTQRRGKNDINLEVYGH